MTDTPIIWTEPLELVCDDTPVVFEYPDGPPDAAGYYFLIREDGLPFTVKQSPNLAHLIVTPEGKYWSRCGLADPVLVRNRAQMDAQSDAPKAALLPSEIESNPPPQEGYFLVWGPHHHELWFPYEAERFWSAREASMPSHLSSRCFTHWMPMPPPPTAMMAERDKGGEA